MSRSTAIRSLSSKVKAGNLFVPLTKTSFQHGFERGAACEVVQETFGLKSLVLDLAFIISPPKMLPRGVRSSNGHKALPSILSATDGAHHEVRSLSCAL